jgi:uncharacterized lipoprotein YmbA
MKNYPNHFIVVVFITAVVAGCASAPSRFYTLNSTVVAGGSATNSCAIVIDPVSIPADVDHPQFTVQVTPNRVTLDEFNRWAAPLNENIARVVAENLAAQLGTPRVAAAQVASFKPDYRVAISIQKFESIPGKSAQLEALWVVRNMSGGETYSGRTVANEPVKDNTFESLAAAHSRALARVSSDIAAVIRVSAEGKP